MNNFEEIYNILNDDGDDNKTQNFKILKFLNDFNLIKSFNNYNKKNITWKCFDHYICKSLKYYSENFIEEMQNILYLPENLIILDTLNFLKTNIMEFPENLYYKNFANNEIILNMNIKKIPNSFKFDGKVVTFISGNSNLIIEGKKYIKKPLDSLGIDIFFYSYTIKNKLNIGENNNDKGFWRFLFKN